jgi:hypothetical protein
MHNWEEFNMENHAFASSRLRSLLFDVLSTYKTLDSDLAWVEGCIQDFSGHTMIFNLPSALRS